MQPRDVSRSLMVAQFLFLSVHLFLLFKTTLFVVCCETFKFSVNFVSIWMNTFAHLSASFYIQFFDSLKKFHPFWKLVSISKSRTKCLSQNAWGLNLPMPLLLCRKIAERCAKSRRAPFAKRQQRRKKMLPRSRPPPQRPLLWYWPSSSVPTV